MNSPADQNRVAHAAAQAARSAPGRVVRAPRGTTLTCKSWLTEAAYRMLQNNLDPDVAERPEELVVYGGIGRAARDWASFDRILECLKELDDDESLLIQSGKPVGVFKTHADAPRVLLANSNLVPKWATWEHFHELDRQGLFMYGQMTAGSLDLHRHPGHRAGHLRNLRRGRPPALRRQHGRAAGSSPRAWAAWAARSRWPPRFAGAVSLNIECQQASIDFRLRTRYLDKQADRPRRRAARWSRSTPRRARRSRSACSAMPPRSCPSWSSAPRPAASSPTSSPTRPRRTT